jgi:hypothetical protein
VFLHVVPQPAAEQRPTRPAAAATALPGTFLLALGGMLALSALLVVEGAALAANAVGLLYAGCVLLGLSVVVSFGRLSIPALVRLPVDVVGIFTLSAGLGAHFGVPLAEHLFLLLGLGVLWFAVPAGEWVIKTVTVPLSSVLGRFWGAAELLLAAAGLWLLYQSLTLVQLV